MSLSAKRLSTHADDDGIRRVRAGEILAGQFRIDGELGRGAMATVFAATHCNGARVAIKVLHPNVASDATQRERFRAEARIGSRLDHPGVARALGEGTRGGIPFLVLEHLEGETLKAHWAAWGRKLPLCRVLDVTLQLLDVLAAVHATGIVHRDVKPDNVFLTRDGRVKLLDFGIAREPRCDEARARTETGAMLGTPAFMAPEHALAHWDEVDARSDLFSVGATMWMLLTGALVHPARTLPDLFVAAATASARPIRTVLPDLPIAVARVVDRALSFDRHARWSDAKAMRAALLEAAKQLEEGARPTRTIPMQATPAPADLEETTRASAPPTVLPSGSQSATPSPTPDRRFWLGLALGISFAATLAVNWLPHAGASSSDDTLSMRCTPDRAR